MTNVSQTQLEAIWAALNERAPERRRDSARRIMQRVIDDGWMYSHQLEDVSYDSDPRAVGYRHGVDLAALSEARGYPWISVMHRPRMRSIGAVGIKALSAADAASFFMDLEKLGFAFDPTSMIESLRSAISKKRLVTGSELNIFWARKIRGKSIITLEAQDTKWSPGEIKRGRFDNGYRHETWFNADGSIYLLAVKGPKFRARAEPVETKCSDCGFTWWRGDPDSSALHRAEHRNRMHAIDPQPSALMIAAKAKESEPELVSRSSPKWKHFEIYRRASAFRREEGYDFVQWDSPEGDDDPHVQGFLITNEESIILGAVAFRWREPKNELPFWGLQWAWVCPRARRSGVLSSRWQFFRERFGEFYIESPVSPSMHAFLAKHGDAYLAHWPSLREEKAAAVGHEQQQAERHSRRGRDPNRVSCAD